MRFELRIPIVGWWPSGLFATRRWVALSIFAIFSVAVLAPDTTRGQIALPNGASQNGTILVNGTNSYSFTANTGQNIVLRIGTTNFYASLNLYGPDGAMVKSVGDSGHYHDVALSYQATNSGTYAVFVSSYSAGGSGTYQLHLAEVPGAFILPAGDEGGALTNGGNHSGTITLGDLDPWRLTANAGDNITLRVGTSGFPPSLDLLGLMVLCWTPPMPLRVANVILLWHGERPIAAPSRYWLAVLTSATAAVTPWMCSRRPVPLSCLRVMTGRLDQRREP